MIRKTLRSFSLIESLQEIRNSAIKHDEKKFKDFKSTYEEFLQKNLEDIYCYSKKVTPSQIQRADLISEEIVKLSTSQNRALTYLLNDMENRNFNYRPYLGQYSSIEEELWAENLWPSIHPANLDFQKEIGEFGLLGYQGFPQSFIDKLISGEIFGDD